jgi:SWIM zinc finger
MCAGSASVGTHNPLGETRSATVTISADDPRSIKSLEIAAGASTWIKCTARDGRQLLGIPSQCQAGTYYLVDPVDETCDCQDAKRNGLTRGRIGQQGLHIPCKHVGAALLHIELVKAQQTQRPQRRGHLSLLPSAVQALAVDYVRIHTEFGEIDS